MNSEVKFDDLGLSKEVLNAIKKKGFTNPSEIQAKIIPLVLEKKHDIIGVAQTGSGKTGAFGLPLIDIIGEGNKIPKVIILTPTRELAIQVSAEIDTFKEDRKIKSVLVYGGQSIQNQIKDLSRGCDIVVGTPGRVLDLLRRNKLDLRNVENFILDEADEMLKMGFIEDIEMIFDASSPKKRVLLFSATMPPKIKALTKKYMKKQVIVEVEKKVENKLHIKQYYFKAKMSEKYDIMTRIIDSNEFFYGIVFCRTKSDVEDVTDKLRRDGYDANCIHGDITQNKREKILNQFRNLKINILVATDVAARGIDVSDLTHVINHSIPKEPETYTHRIGRTGRAGKSGIAISFVTPREMDKLSALEKANKVKLEKGVMPDKADIKDRKESKLKMQIEKLLDNSLNNNFEDMANELIKKYGATEVISTFLTNYTTVKSENPSRDDGDRYRSSSKKRSNSRSRSSGGGNRDRGDRGDRDRRFSNDRDSARSGGRDRDRQRPRNREGSGDRGDRDRRFSNDRDSARSGGRDRDRQKPRNREGSGDRNVSGIKRRIR